MNFQMLSDTLKHTFAEVGAASAPARRPEVQADRGEEVDGRAAFAAALTAKLDAGRDDDMAREMDAAALREQQQQEQLRGAAEQMVASAFVLPLLQQVRQEPLRSDLFHGGFAEDAFGQQLDTHLADEIVRGSNFPLVDAVEQYITRNGQPASAALGQQVNFHG